MTPSSQSAPETAYNWLRSYIASLPRDAETFLNEAVLTKETGTSRTPVREALLRLEAEGFIKRVPHKGAYVPRYLTQTSERSCRHVRSWRSGPCRAWTTWSKVRSMRCRA
nr:GntR family transcriptional regulator [Pseudarthrobacter sp. GA104]